MHIQDKIDADGAACEAARLAYEQAGQALADDQAKLAAIAPHLAAWDALVAFADTITDDGVKSQIIALANAGKDALMQV